MRQSSKPSIRHYLLVALIVSIAWASPNDGVAQQIAPPAVAQAKPAVAENNSHQATADATDLEFCETPTANFIDVTDRVKAEIDQHGAKNVLLVVDVDNTTLAMDQPLGSDQWYGWQYDFIFRNAESKFRIAKDLNELLQIQGTLFALGGMHPPEPEQPQMIAEIQNAGCCTIVLTSRGPEFRNATERELIRNGYDFNDSALEIIEPARGRFLPYDKARPNTHGLSKQELDTLRDPRPVSYSQGIFMTAGQNKGYMLRTLLARSPRTFKAIVFADDHDKHTGRMAKAFKDSGITTACFHYIREQPNVDAFKESDKEAVAKQWDQLNNSIRKTFDGPSD